MKGVPIIDREPERREHCFQELILLPGRLECIRLEKADDATGWHRDIRLGPSHGLINEFEVLMNFEFGKPYHHKSIDQCRAVGRVGGLRSACNRRLRRMAEPPAPAGSRHEPDRETAHEASMLLDQQFPWLRGAARPVARRPTV